MNGCLRASARLCRLPHSRIIADISIVISTATMSEPTLQKRGFKASVQLNRYHTGYSWQHLRGTTKA